MWHCWGCSGRIYLPRPGVGFLVRSPVSMSLVRRIFAMWVFGLLAAFSVCGVRAEGLMPSSKLRPSDPARFFPNLVRFSDEELLEMEAILNQLNRPDLIKHVQKKRS